MDFALNVFALAVVPFLLAVLGGHLASLVLDPKKQRRWKLAFWGIGVFGCAIVVWQQLRSSKHDDQLKQDNQAAVTQAVSLAVDPLNKKLDQILHAKTNVEVGGHDGPIISTAKPASLSTKRPTLDLSIEGLNIATPTGMEGDSEIVATVTVHNNSENPTTASEYRMEITTPDRVKHQAVFLRFGALGDLHWSSENGTVTTIQASDALEEKTENHEILPGGTVRGRLLFLAPGVSHALATDPRSRLFLSAKDRTGKSFVISETIADISKR